MSIPSRIFPILILATLATSAAKLPEGFSEEKIAKGLNPVTMAFSPDGRLFLCEKHGLLRVVSGKEMLEVPALDLSAKVDAWNERGLLSVCFDPEFGKNGWIYVYYTHNRDPKDGKRESSNNRVSRFTMKGDIADPGSEKVILELNNLSKTGWHNGGGLAFGKDGMLYVSTGENAHGPNAQDPGNLLGKLLRINRDGSIPKDNPNYRDYKGENRAIVALGFRNAFHISVQPGSGLLYTNDVGANFEEIEAYDTAAKPVALNYGWPEIDGPAGDRKTPAAYQEAAYPYDHGKGKGVAICGGDFLNPSKPGAGAFPESYTGKFFFGDYAGWIKYIDPAEPGTRHDFAEGINRALDIASAPDGTLWYIERNGRPGGSDDANSESEDGILWCVSWTGGGSAPAEEKVAVQEELPATLSATGIFRDRNLTPKDGVLPYSLNGSIWADGAEVSRWVVLPEGGKVVFSPTEDYKWPGGTRFVQHFELVTDAAKGTRRRLETRLLVLDETGAFGYGGTYRWREDGKDADLVEDGGTEEILNITDTEGSTHEQTWIYPASGLCYLCHTPNAGFVLGPKTHRLGAGQLMDWDKRGMFSNAPAGKDLEGIKQVCAVDDESQPLEKRVSSYLDANCSHCHRPGGTGAEWDARFGSFTGIINGTARNNLGIDGAQLVMPGDVGKSLMHHRMASVLPTEQMPPVTRNVPDKVALEVLEKWINSLEAPSGE